MDILSQKATANEPFECNCPNCGKIIRTYPAAPGRAQTTCPKCGKTFQYIVNAATKNETPIMVTAKPSFRRPGAYEITEHLRLGLRYSLKCPNPKCSGTLVMRPNKLGDKAVVCKNCSTVTYLTVTASENQLVQEQSAMENLVRPIPSTRYSGEYEIIGKLEVGQQYCFLCPNDNCSTMNSFVPQVRGESRVTCNRCGKKIHFTTENPTKVTTEPIIRHYVPCDAFIVWRRPWCISHEKKLFSDTKCVTTIGRYYKKQPSDIMIRDRFMSAQSLKVEREGALFKATVLRATNPLTINGNIYSASSVVYLKDGDIIKMGRTRLTFRIKEKK